MKRYIPQCHDLKIRHQQNLKSKKLARSLCGYSSNNGFSFLYLHDEGEKTERMETNDKGMRDIIMKVIHL